MQVREETPGLCRLSVKSPTFPLVLLNAADQPILLRYLIIERVQTDIRLRWPWLVGSMGFPIWLRVTTFSARFTPLMVSLRVGLLPITPRSVTGDNSGKSGYCPPFRTTRPQL